MAAKNKRSERARLDEVTVHAQRASAMQFRAAQHRDELLEEARALMASGRIREARAVEKRASQVERLRGALESEAPTPAEAPARH